MQRAKKPKAKPGLLPIVGQAGAPAERADAARNRERILDAAHRLLRRRNISEICMDAVAEAAGVGKGTLYRRFADRTALCHALLDEEARKLQERALARFGLPPSAPSVDHALALLAAVFEFTLDHASILSEAWAAQRGRAERLDHPAHVWQRSMLVGHLQEAARRREIPPIDLEVTAEVLLAGLHPDVLTWLVAQQGGDDATVRQRLTALWRRAIGAA